MKMLRISLLLALAVVATSCSTVRVAADYDREIDFSTYKTYAFYKPGIDQVQVSELDKKRILRAIDANLSAKGLTKSENPDMLVSFFTKERERVDVYNDNFGYGWGWGWGPYWGGYWGGTTVSSSTEGSLFIDFIDAQKNQLVWQGVGTATLITNGNIEKKEARINKIVSEVILKYPPGSEKK